MTVLGANPEQRKENDESQEIYRRSRSVNHGVGVDNKGSRKSVCVLF